MKSISQTYVVENALDGEHYVKVKIGTWDKMWTYFNFNKDVREHLALYPQARIRLRNATENKIIGVLAYDEDKHKFLHLKG